MDALYQFCQSHQLIIGFAMPIILIGLGIIFTPAKVIKGGFLTSQWIHHCLGAKAEARFEDIMDEFVEGLHSDDEGTGTTSGTAVKP